MRTQILRWCAETGSFGAASALTDAHFVLYFGPNEIIKSERFQAELRAAAPNAHVLGCTTGTAICGVDLADEAAFAVAARLDAGSVRLARACVSRESARAAGLELAGALDAPDLAGVLVLCDSLNVDGIALIDGLRSGLRPGAVISGGLASDGSAFEHTLVGADCDPQEMLVGALGFYGSNIVMSQGHAHGWDEFGPPRRITKSAGLELLELDGRPALDLYERYLGADAAELPASALRFPLLIINPDNPDEQIVRTVLDVDRERRSMTFASAIPEGWSARLMRGAFDHLTEGAREAAKRAARGAADGEGLALLVSCVGRRIVMGQATADEVEAVAETLVPRFSQCGFYSHGEISTASNDTSCGLHNQTMTILTIQDAA
jgi:hypothetical protein